MNHVMRESLVGIAHACKLGFANRQSAYALDIIADALTGDADMRDQRAIIQSVSDHLALDGVPADGDGERLLAAARVIAAISEQRSEDRYVWGD